MAEITKLSPKPEQADPVSPDVSGAETPVSATETITTPGGVTFDMLRANESDRNLVAKVLDEAIAYCEENDAQAARILKGRASFEYKMQDAMNHTKNPEVKATLLRLLVTLRVEEGDHSGAVNALRYSKAAKLDLPQYDMQFLTDRYDAEFSQGEFDDAWRIAMDVLAHRKKMVKSSASLEVWRRRKAEAYSQMLRKFVAEMEQMDLTERSSHIHVDLMILAIRIETNDDFGAGSAENVVLQRRVIELMVKSALEQGDRRTAAWYAREAGTTLDEYGHLKPEPKVKTLMRKVAKLWGSII